MTIDKTNPFSSLILERFPLTKSGSTKETYHLALSLKGADLPFKSGDSLGIFAQNDPTLIQHLVEALKATGEEEIVDPRSKEHLSLRHFLTHRANLSRLSSSFLRLVHERANSVKLEELLKQENRAVLLEFLQKYDPLDILKEYGNLNFSLQEVCNQFSPLLPRFYSVASSPKVSNDSVDLLVTVSTYTHAEEKRYGVASHFLCHLAEIEKTPIPIYLQPARHFQLPADHSLPIIMVGPGTGVAPFRAFMHDRSDAKGKNWLFFGERHSNTDFFYEDFWKKYVSENRLRLDAAFSRDQEQKLYVQHKMQENGEEIWKWLQEGAHFYVCGDADPMAKDVESTLLNIFMNAGRLTLEDARAYLKQLRTEKRYQADVY